MKKRLLALLLTGLIAMSAVACNNTSDNPNIDDGTTTEATTPAPSDSSNPTDPNSGYQIVDQVVYNLASTLNLRNAANTDNASIVGSVSFLQELRRVKYSSEWSVVVYNGTEYYVSSAWLTSDYVPAEKFNPMTPVVMYVMTEKASALKYASLHDKLYTSETVMKTYKRGDMVKVVASAGTWYQIEVAGNYYYVKAERFSTTKPITEEQLQEWANSFNAFNTPTTYYVSTEHANMRKYPSSDDLSSILGNPLNKGDAVKVLDIKEVGGSTWAMIEVTEGGINYNRFVHRGSLTVSMGGAATLDDLLASGNFERITPKTLYVNNNVKEGLKLRKTPDLNNNEDSNLLPWAQWPKAKAALTIVAKGVGESSEWYIVQFSDGNYYFTTNYYLTPFADGTPILTLEAIKADTNANINEITPTSKKILQDVSYFNTVKMDSAAGTYSAGQIVKVVASGTIYNNNGAATVFIVEGDDGACFIVTANPAYVGAV